jgi:transcriptional regulator with XRE-family HTH domain
MVWVEVVMANREAVSFRAGLLGRLMRELREESGLPLKYVAAYLGVDFGLIRRFQHGGWAPTRDQMAGLLNVYREHDPLLRDQLLRLAEAVWRSGSEVDFEGAVQDESFADLLWLEAGATRIQQYSATGLPALLHTAEYAEHLAAALLGADAAREQIDARVELARRRQQAWQRPEPVGLELVLDECALHHPPSDRRVWVGQLDHLVHMAAWSNVRIQVLPANVPRPPQVAGGFTVFTLSAPFPPSMVHIEHVAGRLLLESIDHLSFFVRLQGLALAEDASTEFLADVLANSHPQ